jgi:hypothetical protein
MATTPVYLEVGTKKVFACTVDWPGWARSGKDEEQALDALAAYVDRYRPVAERAGVVLAEKAADRFEVVERVPGNGTTDFGAPGVVPSLDSEPLTARQAGRLVSLVEASWAELDKVVAGAPATLRKGPRGGGRDRDAIATHVHDAEAAYARQVGVRLKDPGQAELRAAVAEALRSRPSDTKWPVRYAARRIAWHVLDHAWEIEDKST